MDGKKKINKKHASHLDDIGFLSIQLHVWGKSRAVQSIIL